MDKFIYFLESIFFPWDARCIVCGGERTDKFGLCEACRPLLPPPEGDRCRICLKKINDTVTGTNILCGACAKERPAYEKVYAPLGYTEPVRRLIHAFKFKNKKYLAHPFAEMILNILPEDTVSSVDLIIPVPASKARIKEYGYNQSLILARELSRRLDKPINKDVLLKRDGQKQMALLNEKERHKNTKGFYFTSGNLDNKNILLVDDICTTGETLRECAFQLKKASAGKIYCVCIARTEFMIAPIPPAY